MNLKRLTKKEVAELSCVDIRTITNRLGKGLPSHRDGGELFFVWSEVHAWNEQQIRDDARATRQAGGNEDAKTEAAELKLRQLRVETENAETDLYERRGRLVTVDFMREEFQRIGEGLREGLLRLPGDLASPLGSCVTLAERKAMLQDGVNELMPLLASLVNEDAAPRAVVAVR